MKEKQEGKFSIFLWNSTSSGEENNIFPIHFHFIMAWKREAAQWEESEIVESSKASLKINSSFISKGEENFHNFKRFKQSLNHSPHSHAQDNNKCKGRRKEIKINSAWKKKNFLSTSQCLSWLWNQIIFHVKHQARSAYTLVVLSWIYTGQNKL